MSTKTAVKQQKSPAITELELVALETTRETLSLLRKQATEAEKRVKGLEQDLILRLQAGARVQGNMTAIVQEVSGQCRPPWKDLYIGVMVRQGVSPETAEAEARRGTIITVSKALVIGPKT